MKMAQIEDIEKLRKKRSRRQNIKRLGLFLLLVAALAGIWYLWQQVKDSTLAEQITGGFAEIGSGDGYPMEFAGITVHEVDTMGNMLLVLTDTHLHIYNKNGKEIRTVAHDFANPVMKHSGSRVLLYDTASKKIRVENKTGTVKELSFDYPVLFASISDKNDVTIITKAQRYLGQVQVFDQKMDEAVFSWLSAESYLYGAAVDDGGNLVAISSVSAEAGDLVSTLSLYRLDGDQPLLQKKYVDETVHNMTFQNGELVVLTDKAAYYYSLQGKEKANFSFSSDRLRAFYAGEKNCAALVGDFREFKSLTLYILGEAGEQTGQITLTSQVGNMRTAGGFVALLMDNRIEIYNKAGEYVKTISPETEILHMAVSGQIVYYVTPSAIYAEKIDG